MTRQYYDPLNDTNVRKEARPDGSYALFGTGNKHLGNVAAPLSPSELGRRQYEQDAAYIAAREGKSAPASMAGIQSSGGLGATSLSNNTYGQPINRESSGLPTPQEFMSARADDPERAKRIAAARATGAFAQTVISFNQGNAGRQRMDAAGNIFDLQTPYQRSMNAINRGDVSAFKGQPRTPASIFAGQSLNGGSGKTYGVDGGSVTFNGGGLPKGFSGYQTADGKYKTIGPNGEVGIHDNEQAAIASLQKIMPAGLPMVAGATPTAPRLNTAMANQVTPAEFKAAQSHARAAVGQQQTPLPSYSEIFADRGAIGVAGRAAVDTGRGLVAGAKTADEMGAAMANEAVRFVGGRRAADAFVVPTQRQVFTTGVNSARILLNNLFTKPRAAAPQVMPYNAPGNPITAAPAPAPLVTPAMQTGTGAPRRHEAHPRRPPHHLAHRAAQHRDEETPAAGRRQRIHPPPQLDDAQRLHAGMRPIRRVA
jgi:hypothetical protein